MIISIVLGVNLWLLGTACLNWGLAPRLRPGNRGCITSTDDVSVLIPCRNEAGNIGLLLKDLRAVGKGIGEILVYDDQSTDQTAEIVADAARSDKRVRLIRGGEKPEEWLGKHYGCACLAEEAKGAYFLFLDADVRMSANGFEALNGTMQLHHYDLLTVFPTQICVSRGEQIVVPVMHRVLLTLLPLILMRQNYFSSLSAANGQVMFFNAMTYRNYEFHKRFRREAVEDIAIVRFMKKQKLKTMCYLAGGWIHCRMYRSYTESMDGFSKNVATFFGNSYAAGFAYALTGVLSYAAIGTIKGVDWLLALLLLIHLLTEAAVARASSADLLRSMLHYPLRGGVLTLLLWKSYNHKRKNSLLWKGRKINL